MTKFFVVFLIFALLICALAGVYCNYSVVDYSDKIFFYNYSDTASFGRSSWQAALSVFHLLDSVGDTITRSFAGVFASNGYPLQKFSFSAGDIVEVDGVPVQITSDSYIICGFYNSDGSSFTGASYDYDGYTSSVLVKKCSAVFDFSENETIECTITCKCTLWGRPLNRLFGNKTKIVMKNATHTYVWYDECHNKRCSTIVNADELRLATSG